MATVDLLLFGPRFPELRLASSPGGGATFQARQVYSLDLSARLREVKEQKPAPGPLSWRYLWEHTTDPEGKLLRLKVPYFRFERLSPNQRQDAWVDLTTRLLGLCESDPERQFFKKLVEYQQKANSDPNSLWEEPAIIPQVWVNFITSRPQDAIEAKERARTPFRVDFLIVDYGDENIVVEIDGHQHYQTAEAAVATLTKSRHLLRAGWKHYRFHSWEVEALTADEFYYEIGLFVAPPF